MRIGAAALFTVAMVARSYTGQFLKKLLNKG